MQYKLPSNKNFGIVFFIVFFLIGIWPLINNGEIRKWSLIIAIIFLILGVLNSKILTPLNNLWMKLGIILGNIIAPIIMALIFFGVVTPTGLLLKLFRKDILKLKKNKSDTYWLKKDNMKSSMKNQF